MQKTKNKVSLTNRQWWKNFAHKLFKDDDLLLLSNDIFKQYSELSADHLYHMTMQVARFIYFEFSERESDTEQLKAIRWLVQIINQQKIFTHAACGSYHLLNLSELNAANEQTIQWILSEAVGPRCNKLGAIKAPADYEDATKAIIKTLANIYLRNYYNFLATKPLLNETQQTIVNELAKVLPVWQAQAEKEPSHTPSQGQVNDEGVALSAAVQSTQVKRIRLMPPENSNHPTASLS